MAERSYFSVEFRESSPTLKKAGLIFYAEEKGVQLIVDGLVYAIQGEPALPAPLAFGTLVAERLLASYLKNPNSFFERIYGQATVTILSANRVLAFRSRLSPNRIYYSKSGLSNRLYPVYQWDPDTRLSDRYFFDFVLERKPQHYDSADTPFESIFRLLPGSLLEFNEGKVSLKNLVPEREYRYLHRPQQKLETVAGQVRELMESAVDARSDAERPTVCELSGGLDSAFVTALVAKKSSQVSAFMYAFSEKPSHRQSEDYARLVAESLNIRLTVIPGDELPKSDLSLPQPYRDEPEGFFWQGALFTPSSSALMTEGTLLFSGFGSDQLFLRDPQVLPWLLRSGELAIFLKTLNETSRELERSQSHLLWQTLLLLLPKSVFQQLNRLFSKLRFNPLALDEMEPESIVLEAVSWLRVPKSTSSLSAEKFGGEGKVRTDFSYLVGPNFSTDPYYENRGIQTVHPYCDLRLIDFVLGEVSWDLIHDWGAPYKNLMREAQRGLIPEAVRLRQKNEFQFDGFLGKMLRDNQNYVREIVSASDLPQSNHLDLGEATSALEGLLFGINSNSGVKLLNLIGYRLWWRDFVREW